MVKDLPQFTEQVEVQPRALPDRQAALSSLGDRLTQFGAGIAKVAAAKSKGNLEAEKDAAQIQVRDGIARIREGVLDPARFSNQATESYDAQVRGLMKGVLSNSDPKIQPFIANFGSNYGDKNRNVVVDRVEKLKRNQRVGGLQEYNKKTTDDAINAKLSDQVIPDPEDKTKSVSTGDFLMSRVHQANNNAMNHGLITPKEAFTYKQAADESYADASYLHHFRKVLADRNKNPNKWIESLGKNKSVDPAMKHKVQAQALGMMNQAKQSVDTSTNLIKQQGEDTIRQVSNGTLDINSPHVSNVKLRMGAVGGEDQQNFEHRLTAASVFSVTKQSMKFIPFMQSKAILKQLAPAADDPGFKYKNKINSALESQIDTFQAAFKKDRFAYVSDNPDVTHAFEARMTAANDGVTKIQPAQLQTINPLAVALDKERMMGANEQQLSVMRNDTAADIVAHIEAQPDPAQQLQLVNDVYDSYGQYSTIAARDLKRAGMPENIMALAGLQNIPKSKPFIQGMLLSFQQSAEIQKRLKEGGKTGEQFSNFQSNATQDLQTLFNTYGNTPDTEDFKSSMNNAVATAAAGYFLQHNGTINASKCSTRIADAMFNNRYSGYLKEVRVPANVPLSNAKDALFAKEKDLPNVPFLGLDRPAETDETKIMRILQNNSGKNFVQRILKPEGKPTLDLPGGQFATHKMSWSTVDGKPIVYPKVIQDAKTGKLKELSAKDAVDHAIKTKQFITAKNNDEAEWFSSNYKKVWNIDGKNITLKKGISVGLTPGEKLQEDQDAIQAGHWRSIGDDSGAYWVDAHGFTPMFVKAGTPTRYEVHWKDLQDKTSELHGLMAKHPRKRLGLF
jgi:hypothetical protein